ncbi:rhamnogalacturonan acetylesterase [Sediminibacterium soli]|uniref:rhamnogalacturonan acetylesterase n=1 Tax=Sediminibacterium soli TaxID=2698829 RepID=UPI00137A7B70|nr:rhamnogalacturonan acetylesterase [Sediminibacterium soli]NCI46857.1 rhamnogalacturonan acetylesterase [Sediminibacterium soli]
MRCFFLLLLFGNLSAELFAQSYRFDFGNGKARQGYTRIHTDDRYTADRGYGFEPGALLQAVERKNMDFITASAPFFFSVKLPEGNYTVTIVLGDTEAGSATTVRAENRRLLFANIRTKKGQRKKVIATIHIRDSIIRDAQGTAIAKVRLKPREISYAHWDNKLTIEFNDSLPKVDAMEIQRDTNAATVFLAGNSTVVDQDKEPWAAWGQMFPSFFRPGNICIANYAESGETLKAFRGERRLQKIFSLAKPGDYLFIEFAHNDQKPGSTHLDPFTTYQSTLMEWITEARAHGMVPVLVTSMHRRSFDTGGKINNTLLEYPEAMRQTAQKADVALIDLNAMSKTLYEAWGPEKSVRAFVHFPANIFPNQPQALKDDTHFSTYGAYELARCVVQEIRRQKLSLASYLKKDTGAFDPSHPDPWEQWYWPLSPLYASQKPDGN